MKVEKGEVIVTYLTAEGAIYTQTEGTFKAENGWFSNSILNIQGGVLDVTKSNKEGILGNNTVNISGNNVTPSIDNKAHPDDKIKYKDGLTQVVIGTLTSDSVVNIKAGGLLDVESINLTENKKTLTLDGGVIQTSADQIFYQTKKEVLPLDDKEPVQSVELPGNLVTSSVGAVKDSVKAGLTLKSGNLVLDDKTFSTSLVSEVTESLTSAFGSATKLTVNFLGAASTTIFNIEEAEKLASNLQTNVVLNGVTLYNEKNGNDNLDWLNVGQTRPDLHPGKVLEASMGFKNIALATGVTIADGRELALVGNIAGTLSDSDFSSNLNKLLTSADNGGEISVENGTFTLGTNGAAEPSVGWINSSAVTKEGNLNVKNGQFAIWNLANNGSVKITANAALRVNNLEGAGTIDNQGQFLVKDYEGKAAAFELNCAFSNSGASSLLDASAVENSSVNNYLLNEGKTIFKNLTVTDSLINEGTFTVAEGLNVEGDVDNAGTLSYRYAKAAKDATMMNSGTETGESLSLAFGAERTNKGSTSLLIFNIDEGASSTTEVRATDMITGNFKVEGTHVNKGRLNASGSTDVKGQLSNLANATFNSLSLIQNGIYENKGTEFGENITLNEGSIYKSSGNSRWKYVTVREADLHSSGTFAAENFALSSGAVSLTGGEFKTANAVLDGGTITVGDASGATSASAELASSAFIKSMITVLNGSELGFGVGALAYAETLNAPKGSAHLSMTQKMILAEGSGLTVGENAHPAAQDASGATSLIFGDGTTTIVDCALLKDGTGAFSTNGQDASLTVAPTATLILGNIDEAGDYTVVSGFDTEDNISGNGWTGGWTGDKLYALAQDGTGINWELELHNDASKVWVSAILNDVLSMYPDIAIPNIANDELRHAQKDAFTYSVLRRKDLSAAEKTAIVNSAANISFAGGTISVGFNDLTTALDSVENRVSMKGESFTEEGLMRDWPHGNNLWIDLTGGKQKYKRFAATGVGEAGYKTDAFGFTMGFDRKVTQASILGAAFSYNRGSLDSTGDVSKTKNKYNSYGIHAYGAYSPSSRLNVVGTLTYLRSSSDITQHIYAAGFGNADADVKTDLLAAGIRVETTLKARSSSVVPHAGIRYVYAKSEKYDTKVDGKKIWSNKTKANNAVQFPIGVALRGDIATGNGWNIRPQADLTFIPQAGSTNQRTTLTDVNGISDRIS
ncbi:MAG: autotransporter domain-containing protein [Burkholderiales bacterium]|nr:autotransporter domain-containing protein [Burkholderiales bacterium]